MNNALTAFRGLTGTSKALFVATPQIRIVGGIAVRDELPGVDLDRFAGGMFEVTRTFGITTASVESYWIGTEKT